MRVLTLNPGSSSLKLAVLDDETLRFGHTFTHWSGRLSWPEFQDLVLRYDPIDAVAVRFVHGGARPGPVLLDEAELVPDVPVVGCFDTSFHLGLPEHVARYALPRPWVDQPELRRAGFHGLSCEYAQRRAAALLRTPVELLRLVVAHIGSGVSVTAIDGGHSVDTIHA